MDFVALWLVWGCDLCANYMKKQISNAISQQCRRRSSFISHSHRNIVTKYLWIWFPYTVLCRLSLHNCIPCDLAVPAWPSVSCDRFCLHCAFINFIEDSVSESIHLAINSVNAGKCSTEICLINHRSSCGISHIIHR